MFRQRPLCHPPTEEAGFKPKDLAEYPRFDFVMTNPPFYSTSEEATAPRAGDKRSRTGMSPNEGVYAPMDRDVADIGGDMDGYYCEDRSNAESHGGDVGFVSAIMDDSQIFRKRVTWYTSLLAKRSSLDAVLQKLRTLDGVWGNRGQIRTVEFRQENLDIDNTDDDVEGKDNKSGSIRARWGIGWTYERATGRCSACLVKGGLQSFDVWVCVGGDGANNDVESSVGDDDGSERASDEVASRLVDHFENLREFSLKCAVCRTREHGHCGESHGGGKENRGGRRCVTALEERFFDRDPSRPPSPDPEREDNGNLPLEGHFVVDAHVESIGGERNESGYARVRVFLEMYSHTKRGRVVVDRIRIPLPGEIGRTNRRWRRLRKAQEKRQNIDEI